MTESSSQLNTGYLGAEFLLVGVHNPKKTVTFRVPCALRDGVPSRIHQNLGKIKRKNDQRFEAFRTPNRTFFESYPKEPIYQRVFPTIEEAQRWIIDGIPAGIDTSHIQLLSAEDAEKVK
jgi:hypothetical protein